MENNLISSLYILEKNFLVNKYKKQRCYKENKSLFFDFMKNGPIFRSKVCHFQYDPKFLFNRRMGNIRAYKEVRLQLTKFRLSG